ncbi:MAG: membrane protein insertion efficiency factor YidD [Candidatus Babeliales bacterium]|jgi:putative component of membrane protein insertase Oxa1/YidC/SpoIIIJ protein YidD
MKIKQKSLKITFFLIDSIRPLLGPSKVCIYHISCTEYTKAILEQKPFYIALPLIIVRLLSCNPITAIFLKIKFYLKK